MTQFPTEYARRQFPALTQAGDFIFFDNAAGAQVPARVIDAVTDHLVARNVQRGGPYGRSLEVDAMIVRARHAVAAFLNATNHDDIAFGLNATAFIRAISLAVGQTLTPRSDIVVTDLDHEANVATWLALESMGASIRWWRVRNDGRLYTEDLDAVLTPRTRLVACTLAANATGSVVDIAEVSRRAHAAGAEVFVDAVHYAPHGPLDVQALGCDYLVCSGYKIFAPHMGFAWGRRESMAALPTFREDFIPDAMPYKLEAGTFVYENVAGMEAAVAYLEDLGRRVNGTGTPPASRQAAIRHAMDAIAAYERILSAALLDAVENIDGATIYGVTDRARLHERVPTICFSVRGVRSAAIADALAARDIGARSGHMYSPRVIARLGIPDGAAVRVSLVHYNTRDEVARFGETLTEIIRTLS